MDARQNLARATLALYWAFIMILTLVILPQDHPPPNLVPFRSIVHDLRAGGRHLAVNFAGNIVAFLPFGLLIPRARARPTSVRDLIIAGVALSGTIEVLQYATGRRVGDVDDVLLNTLGVVLGSAILRRRRGGARGGDRDRRA